MVLLNCQTHGVSMYLKAGGEAIVVLTEAAGNLLDADTDAVVNTVNTVGVMGKGIALQFKQAYPANFKAYEAACRRGDVRLGRMFVVPTGQLAPPHFIINFPTKSHWRAKSRLGGGIFLDALLVFLRVLVRKTGKQLVVQRR